MLFSLPLVYTLCNLCTLPCRKLKKILYTSRGLWLFGVVVVVVAVVVVVVGGGLL